MWFRFYSEALDDPKVQLLPPGEFRQQFLAATRGEKNAFSKHMRIGRSRLPSQEWAALRSAVFERDDYTCQYCGERGGRLECDHVVAVARGGDDTLENLATACFQCNRSKRDKSLEEWRGLDG